MIRTWGVDADRYVSGENDVITGTMRSFHGDQPAGVIYCHGANDDAVDVHYEIAQRSIMDGCGRQATVHAGDLGFNTFGNDTGITRIGQAIAYLRAEWGQAGPVVLVGGSMGVVNALAYTLAHPTEVLAVAGIIPGLDLASLHAVRPDIGVLIDAAYPPAYDNAVHGPTHSPVLFADDLPAGLPIHLWTASDDDLTLPATADAFVTARPQTGRTNLGAIGHTDAAIAAAVDDVVEFVREFTWT